MTSITLPETGEWGDNWLFHTSGAAALRLVLWSTSVAWGCLALPTGRTYLQMVFNSGDSVLYPARLLLCFLLVFVSGRFFYAN